MNDSESRRRELLRQTRKLYSGRQEIPAVHPRYGRIYRDLYGNEDGEREPPEGGGSFYLRLIIGILCFVCFVCMDQSGAEVAEVSSSAIAEEIGKDMKTETDTLIEAWKNLA